MRAKPGRPQLDLQHPQARGILLACPMGDFGGGGVVDLSGNKRDGSLITGDTPSAWVQGPHGSAIDFDAITDRVNFGNALFLPTANSCSVVVLYSKTDGTNRASSLFGQDTASVGQRLQVHGPFSDGVVYWDYGGASSGTTRLSKSGLSFEHVVWVFTVGPRGMEIWRDGVKEASNSANPTRTGGATDFELGQGPDSLDADLVIFELFEIYDRQLSESEIQAKAVDPWEMYRPRRVVIGFVAAGAALTGTAAMNLPIPTLNAVGEAGPTGTASATLPMPTLAAVGAAITALTGTVSATLPMPTLAATGTAAHTGTAAMTLPMPTLLASGTAVTALTGTAALTLPMPTLAAIGAAGPTGVAAMTLPMPTLAAVGVIPATGTVAMTLPMPSMFAAGGVDGFVGLDYVNRRRRRASSIRRSRR